MSKKIFHRNDIRPALIGMSLSARRLIYICLAKLPREIDPQTGKMEISFNSNEIFEIKVQEYALICGIDYSVAYRQMIEGVKDLMGFVITLDSTLTNKIDPSFPKDWIAPFQVATDGTGYSKGEGFVKIKFHSKLSPFVSDLTNGFTGQFLESAINISESNSSKLYLLLREWVSGNKHVNEKIITFDDLKEALGISFLKTYKEFKSFRANFFDRGIKKVIEKTEFTRIEMTISEKKARKTYKVKIAWVLNKELSKQQCEIKTFNGYNTRVEKTEELRQINGRFMDKREATYLGYDWIQNL